MAGVGEMAENSSKLFDFFTLIGRLKKTKRTGWVIRGVKDPESVADHMYRMAILSFLVNPKDGLDKDKCIKMSLVHDMAESIVGDIAPADGVSKEEKHRREKAAMEHIRSLLPEDTGREMCNLWEEYEFQSSKEAKFVKDLDKFDMIKQAYEYEIEDERPKDLQEFFNSTKGEFVTDQVQSWVKELNEVRDGQTNDKTNESTDAHDKASNSSQSYAKEEFPSDVPAVAKRSKLEMD